MSHKLRIRKLVGALVAAVWVVTACAPAATPTPETVIVTQVVTQIVAGTPVEVEVEVTRVIEAPAPPTATAAPAVIPDVTLTVWFTGGSPEEVGLVQELADTWAAGYEQANVTVDLTTYTFEDMGNAMKLSLDGGTGPDIAYTNPGKNGIELYAAAGHMLDLTDLIVERGWDQRVPIDVIKHWDTTDRTYGISYDVVTVGVFYNADIFEQLGLEPPDTFEEFDALLADVKAAGVTPITTGGAQGWRLTHIQDQLSHGNVPWDNLHGIFTLDPNANWDTPEFLEAVNKFNEWVDLGYFNENVEATDSADADTLFLTGQSALNIGGTWNNATYIQQAEFDVRFFAMPPMNPDLERHMGGYTPNPAWAIPVYSEHQDIALDLLDFMIGEQSAQARWESGTIVAYKFDQVPEPLYPLQADVYIAMQQAMTGQYTDGAQAELRSVAWSSFQEMVAGRLEPETLLNRLQEKYLEVLP